MQHCSLLQPVLNACRWFTERLWDVTSYKVTPLGGGPRSLPGASEEPRSPPGKPSGRLQGTPLVTLGDPPWNPLGDPLEPPGDPFGFVANPRMTKGVSEAPPGRVRQTPWGPPGTPLGAPPPRWLQGPPPRGAGARSEDRMCACQMPTPDRVFQYHCSCQQNHGIRLWYAMI